MKVDGMCLILYGFNISGEATCSKTKKKRKKQEENEKYKDDIGLIKF